jgi:hypothetical protein
MDGRTQIPVIEFLGKRFGARFVDMITEPGPNQVLAHGNNSEKLKSIFERCDISV